MKKLLLLATLGITLSACNGAVSTTNPNTSSTSTPTQLSTTPTPSTTNPDDLNKELNTVDDSQDLKSMDAPDLTE